MKPNVLILAGGVGKRFFPLTINKTMLPLFGKPLLHHSIDQLRRVGLSNFFVVCNPENIDFVLSLKQQGVNVEAKMQPEALGMADAVMLFRDEIKDSPVIIMNAIDTLDDSLFINLLSAAENSYATIAGLKYEGYFPGGYVGVDGNRAVSLIEKPGADKKPSDVVKLVVDYFRKPSDLIAEIEANKSHSDSVYEEALNTLMKKNIVGLLEYSSYWRPLKYSFQILEVMDIYLHHRLESIIHPSAYISKNASIEGNVYIGAGAKVFNYASIKGPAYIGEGAIVGDNALVRESVVEAGAVIGFGSEVTRSYIGPKCMLHHNFIGDSILESRVNPSYGTCFTNTRFDKQKIQIADKEGKMLDTNRDKFGAIVADNAFLGSNSTILPGRIIGADKNCMPGSVVSKNIL